ncbi:carbohydrate kinase family protein [Agathobaculum sp.]|uniref:carbohydrate kinase family protein n=1 Tax=Agathobaculum sp. TaxID=2048138 RepID=UPI002A7EBCC4|nr:carbohydrate kinase family protein [Agathobaculum sp.]MDY3619351.1 carbohydrate kinase family protein [Agathobaculum sp.]
MSTLDSLAGRREEIAGKRIVVGFDGFTDTIVRPLKQAAAADAPALPFDTIREFGEFLIGKAEKSCSVELQVEARQLGGNLPYLSRGAGGLGLDVACIGMLGDGAAEEPFRRMPCTLYPYAPSGQSTCMEFRDGKVLLAADCALPRDAWELVLDATGGDAPALFQKADLLALVNWSELSFSHGLWEHTLDALDDADKTRFAFFDLCDVSRKTDGQIDAVLNLIGGFAEKRTAILSLNENEALTVSARVLDGVTDTGEIARAVRARYGIDEVLVHTVRDSLLCTPRGETHQPTHFVEQPKISTGAGDNFNAASCFAAVMGLPDSDRLTVANAFAHFYISQGYNPTLDELLGHIKALS